MLPPSMGVGGVGEASTAMSPAGGTLVLMAVLVPAVTAVRTPG